MATPYFFAVKSIGLSTCGGRKPCTLLSALRHNRRIIQTELGARSHIDPSRIGLNETLAGAATPEAVAMLAITAMAWAGVPVETLRRDHTQAIELLFSLPTGALADDRAHFKTCTAWAERQFGVDNVLSSDIHRDESAPHCHVLVLPLVGGRMAGSKLLARDKTAKLIESFWREVAQPSGLNRPPKRVTGAAKGLLATRVIETLQGRADPATHSPAWQAIRKAIEFDPQGFAVVLVHQHVSFET